MTIELIPYTTKYRLLLRESLSDRYIKRYTNKGYYHVASILRLYHSSFYLFKIDEDIVGHIVIRKKFPQSLRRVVWIYGVYIFQRYRGKGYGKELMRHTIDTCNANTIFLKVDKNNTIAIGLYKEIGFYMVNQYKNDIVMRYDKI